MHRLRYRILDQLLAHRLEAFGRFVVGRHQLEERARGVPQRRVLERAALVGQLQQELAVGWLHGHDDAWQALLQLHVGSVVMVLR